MFLYLCPGRRLPHEHRPRTHLWPAHLDLALPARLTAHGPHHPTLVHLDFVVVDVQHPFVPGPHVYVVIAIGFSVLQIHDIISAKKTAWVAGRTWTNVDNKDTW